MSVEGVVRCKGCGSWMLATLSPCPVCSKIIQTEKGVSNAESNQSGATMLGARETDKGRA
jgi:tRNA(Arg) A34 adenosine deaminase TadA